MSYCGPVMPRFDARLAVLLVIVVIVLFLGFWGGGFGAGVY